MGDSMTSLYFTICAFFINVLTLIIFTSKKKIKKMDNTLYLWLLITNFLDCLLMIIILLIGYKIFGNENLAIILNRFDFIQYILWTSIFSLYIFNILDNSRKFKKLYKVILIVDAILIIFDFILPINLYRSSNIMYAYGPCVNFIYIVCTFYSVFIIVNMIINFKKIISKKFIPILILAIFMVITLFLNKYKPDLLVIPAIISYVDLIIYFTIENPDLKTLNEYERNKELAINNAEEKSNVLFKISQDVKVPIEKISKISNDALNNNNSDNIHEEIKSINQISKNLSYTVNKVLNISDLDVQKVKLFNTMYNPYSLFSEIVLSTNEKFHNKDVSFKYSVSSFIPEILYGDCVRLKQILNSIINKSFNDTKSGFVDFDVTSIVKYDVCRLIITVSDSSKGIPLDIIDDILSNDYEVNEEELKSIDNINVDLRIIKKLIDIMGGSMYITSEENKGSTFIAVIDQKIKESKDAKTFNSTKKLVEILSNKKKVLLVDDDYQELNIYKNELKRNNLDVITTMYGNDIENLIKANNDFDILFIDDEMKPKNAVELIKNINAKSLKVIVMLNKEKEMIKDHYLNDYPFKDYLLKDDYKEEFKRIINKYL